MIDQINTAIDEYQSKWQRLVAARTNKEFFGSLKPTAVGWKVTNLDELLGYFNELRKSCDQVHFGWVNERWLVTMHLRNQSLEKGIQIIKLMERRPGSKDPAGLDHLDFYNKDGNFEKVLSKESDLKWSKEMNGKVCRWTSVWFAGTEAKLRKDTVIQPCIAELQEVEDKILAS